MSIWRFPTRCIYRFTTLQDRCHLIRITVFLFRSYVRPLFDLDMWRWTFSHSNFGFLIDLHLNRLIHLRLNRIAKVAHTIFLIYLVKIGRLTQKCIVLKMFIWYSIFTQIIDLQLFYYSYFAIPNIYQFKRLFLL